MRILLFCSFAYNFFIHPTLINALTRSTKRYVLILDDYHVIREPAIQASLDFLLEHQPSQLHLVLLSRGDPPLKLSRLRARGQLVEIRDEDLRCSVEEAMQFLDEVMDIRLPNDVLEQVMVRTEGWLVGLQLLGLSLRGHADLADLLDALTGTERYILDYLTEEVLGQQPASIQEFLLRTSILDPLSGPLCDAVLERTNSQNILEELERANMFVCSLDRQRRWFRYHALFTDTLRYWLEQAHSQEIPALYVRASAWYEQQERLNEAINYALHAHAWQRAADLIESETLYSRWEQVAVLRWLRQLPKEIVYARPRLCLSYAMMLFISNQLREIEPWLQAAETALKASHPAGEAVSALPVLTDQERERLLGEVAARRAIIAGHYGESDVAENQAQLALAHLRERDAFQRAVVAAAQGFSALTSGQAAVSAERWREASALMQAAEIVGASVNFLSMAASYVQMGGHLHEAWRMFQQAVGLGSEPGSPPPVEVGVAYLYQADVLREWNQLDAALDLALQGLQFAQQAGYTKYLDKGYLVLVRIHLARGVFDAAEAALRQATQLPNLADNPYQLACLSAVEQVRLWIAQGELDKATRWAENLARGERLISSFAREREDVARVRVLLAGHQPDEALALLESLIAGAIATERFDHVMEMRILQALAYQMRKAEREALAALAEAVRLGEPEGYICRFVDEGPAMAALLVRLREQQRRQGPTPYLDSVLAAVAQEGAGHKLLPQHGLQDPLSERELDVLRELAHGASNKEIADLLFITVDTVKRHVGNILAKLEASNRTQAVVRARRLGLLSDEQ